MRLLLFLLLLISAPTQAQGHSPAPETPAKTNTSRGDAKSSPSISSAADCCQSDGQPAPTRSQPPPTDGSHVWTIVVAFAALVQAIAAVFAVCIYQRQTRLMRHSNSAFIAQVRVMNKQARILDQSVAAAEKSAAAALQTVSSLEKLERPFLMVEVRNLTAVWIVNKGKVPAKITWYNPSGSLRFWTQEDMDGMPFDFDYGAYFDSTDLEVMNVAWVPPDGEMALAHLAWPELRDDIKMQWENGRKATYLLSAVKYRGVLTKEEFITRWCFRWVDHYNGLRLAGPPNYNSNT